MSESMIVVSATMPPEMAEALKALAELEDRSFSAEMRRAVRAHLLRQGQLSAHDSAHGSPDA